MSIRDAAVLEEHQIALTGLPLRCSACFNQDPGRRHIDMDAACDRGYGKDEAVQVAYDDLVLCENCVREAATLINMVAKDDKALENLERQLKSEQEHRRRAERWANTMQEAIAAMPTKPEIDHRKKPRPLRVGDPVESGLGEQDA